LLEKNLAIASYTKALEFRNGKCFRRVTEEGYIEFATPDVSLSERVEEFLPISITVRLSGFAPGTRLSPD
jgi:hypothetical protein